MIGVDFYDTFPASIRFSIFLGVVFFYFLLFKTYTGIIRYSSLKDATRLSKAIASAFITVVVIDTVHFITQDKHIFVLMTVFFYSIVILFALISFRIFIKTLFKYFAGNEEKPEAENLVIIGVNSTTIALAEAFVNDNTQYKLQFFIDKNKFLNDKKVLGIPVVAKTNSIIAILRYNKIKHVVLIKN
jgi:FlaA1/EpsC-like NDP-sugar epimerase